MVNALHIFVLKISLLLESRSGLIIYATMKFMCREAAPSEDKILRTDQVVNL